METVRRGRVPQCLCAGHPRLDDEGVFDEVVSLERRVL